MAGLVVVDLGGGDSSIHLVDDALWDQIQVVWSSTEGTHLTIDTEVIQWLTLQSDSEEEDREARPANAPDREGRVLSTWYTQNYVIERIEIDCKVTGILTLPGS